MEDIGSSDGGSGCSSGMVVDDDDDESMDVDEDELEAAVDDTEPDEEDEARKFGLRLYWKLSLVPSLRTQVSEG